MIAVKKDLHGDFCFIENVNIWQAGTSSYNYRCSTSWGEIDNGFITILDKNQFYEKVSNDCGSWSLRAFFL